MQLDDLTLPSGGTVAFRDSEELGGKEYGLLKQHMVGAANETEAALGMQADMARVLIVSWSIPGRRGLKIPMERGGASSYELLHWKDVAAIERHVLPVIVEMFFASRDDDGPKDDEPATE